MPQELERRFWASRLEALVEGVQRDYEGFKARMQNLDFFTKLTTAGIDMALNVGGMQSIAPPPSPRPGITISSSDKVGPDWRGNPHREPGAIFLTYEQFMATAEKLKEKLLKGAIEPSSEEEIPRLIYSEASA